MNLREFRELAAAHAVGALPPEDERAFTQALAQHPEWRGIVDADVETAALLGESLPEVTPPPALRAGLLDAIEQLPQLPAVRIPESAADVGEPAPPRDIQPRTESASSREDVRGPDARRRRARSIGWITGLALAASIALFAAVTLGPGLVGLFAPSDPAVVALEQVESSEDAAAASVDAVGGGSATLHWSNEQGRAVLVVEKLPRLGDDQDFELWLVRGEQPISIGIMHPGDDERTVLIADSFEPGDAIAVTVEAAGGSPSGAPTSNPIFVIPTA